MKHYLKKVVGIGLACVCAVSLALGGKPIMSYADSPDVTLNDTTPVGIAATFIFDDSSLHKRAYVVSSASRHYKTVIEYNGSVVYTRYNKEEGCSVYLTDSDIMSLCGVSLVYPATIQVAVETTSEEHDDYANEGHYTYDAIARFVIADSYVAGGPWLSEEKAELKQAIKEDKEEEITLTGVSTMDREMSNILKECKADVILKFQYEGVPHEVLIPAGEAPTEDLDYFGPCWLLGRYGDLLKTPEPYIIQKGDTLKDLADKWGVSVGYLMRLNPYIQDNHWIYVGKTLMH